MSRLVAAAARLSGWSFSVASLLYPALMLVIVVNVVLRYGFAIGSIELEELQWHLYSAGFLLGLAQVFREDANVRVDFLSRRCSGRTRERCELAGLVVILIPFLVIFTYYSFFFFARSWALGEVSPHSSGLPARFVIKFILFLSFLVLLLQVLATTAERIAALVATGPRSDES